MNIALIAALAEDGTIGHQGQIPWHLREDLQRFKKITLGHTVIMGRKTFQSIGRPLPGRANLVLTRDPAFRAPDGVPTFASLEDALAHCRHQGESTAFIIGGAEVYRHALDLADRLLLTRVHQDVHGDTRFPPLDFGDWTEVSRQDTPECSFVEYRRRG